MRGALFESAVLAELCAWFEDQGEFLPVTHWRSSDGLEVDFVVEWAGRCHAFECKANATPIPRMGEGLRKWRALMGDAAGATVLVCDAAERTRLGGDVEVVPWRGLSGYLEELLVRGG